MEPEEKECTEKEQDDDVFKSPRLRETKMECAKSLPVHPLEENLNPVVHAILLGCEGLEKVVPLEFLLLDCSKLMIKSGSIEATIKSSFGFEFTCSVSSSVPLLSHPPTQNALLLDIVRFVPSGCIISTTMFLILVLMRHYRFEGYPCNMDETPEDSMNGVYLYADLKLGKLRKMIYGRASDLGSELCVLIPPDDFEIMKDALKSSTFVIEAHDEDIGRRAFNRRIVDRYTEMFLSEEGGSSPAPSPRGNISKGASRQASAIEPEEPEPPKRPIGIIITFFFAFVSYCILFVDSGLSWTSHREG